MEKIREQEKSLAGLTELSGKLSDAEEQYAALKKRMEEAENQRQTLERLQEACRQTQERLDQLGKLDPTEARQELEQLSRRELELSQERDNLLSELDRRRKTVAAMVLYSSWALSSPIVRFIFRAKTYITLLLFASKFAASSGVTSLRTSAGNAS